MARLPLLSNIQPAMPAVIPSVKMGPRASLSWARRTTPAAASLDSLDSTVAPTLTSVRRDHLQHAHIVTKASPSVIIVELSEPYCNNLGQTFHMTLESTIQSSTAFLYRKHTAAKYSL